MKAIQLKIIAVALIMALIMPNFAFAALTYDRNGGNSITGIATYITDDTYVDSKYDAKSINVPLSDIEIYDYNSTTLKQATGNGDEILYSENKNKYFYSIEESPNGSTEFLNYTIKLGTGTQHEQDIATFIYKNALKCNNKLYNLKINIKDIYKEGENAQHLRVRIGSRPKQEDNLYGVSTYTGNVGVTIAGHNCTGNQLEVAIECFAIDNDGNAINISGLLGVTDIDLNQGTFIKGFKANNSNIYMYEKDSNAQTIGDINYKVLNEGTADEGTYIYSTVNTNNEEHNVYALIDEKSEMDLTLTFDDKNAGSAVKFYGNDEALKVYKKITTKVTGGTITPNITNIKNGENKNISYSPTDSSRQYLKSITVDGTPLTDEQMKTYQSEYAFTNITEDHYIEVVYANKPVVSFNPMGGSPTPEDQIVDLNDTAEEPEDEPTKDGYTFEGWQNPDGTTPYDFNTPVTEDIELKAKWSPINYNLHYELNGGTPHADNVDRTFTVEDEDITYAEPTRDGYTFDGWYLNEDFSGQKQDSLSPATTFNNVTVYAKWTPVVEPETSAKYVVEHYKEDSSGEYKLDTSATENKTGDIGTTATAEPKNFIGYKENKAHENRKVSGTITEDGSLVLRLYYEMEKYNVTFDTDGGNPKPENQIVKYKEKATEPTTEPTKDGYTFEYWYYINDKEEKVRYNFDEPVTEDIQLYAKWEKDITPTPSNPTPSTSDSSTAGKNDPTLADKILPNTGIARSIIMIVLGIAALLGIRYYRLKNIMK